VEHQFADPTLTFSSRLVSPGIILIEAHLIIDSFPGDNFNIPYSREDAAQVLMKIKSAIDKSSNFKVTIFLPNANVPLLRVLYLRTDFECELIYIFKCREHFSVISTRIW
jgi:hypothetical protein